MDGFPLFVDSAGIWRGRIPRAWLGEEMIVLAGATREAHRGVVLMQPCRLEADPTSPLRMCSIGQVFPDLRELLAEIAAEDRPVVLLRERGIPGGVVAAARAGLFAQHVRLVYDAEARLPGEPVAGVQLPLVAGAGEVSSRGNGPDSGTVRS